MFQAFDQLPHCFVQWRWDASLFSPIHDRAVHEIDFGLTLGEYVLQHAGAMLAGSVRAFLHQCARIAVQLDAQRLGNRFAFSDQIVE